MSPTYTTNFEPMPPDENDAHVTYPVRDLLDQIKLAQAEGFARVETSLANKVDKTDIVRMETRMDQFNERQERHEGRIGSLEGWRREEAVTETVHGQHVEQVWSWKKRAWAAAGAILATLATVFGPYIGTHLHF